MWYISKPPQILQPICNMRMIAPQVWHAPGGWSARPPCAHAKKIKVATFINLTQHSSSLSVSPTSHQTSHTSPSDNRLWKVYLGACNVTHTHQAIECRRIRAPTGKRQSMQLFKACYNGFTNTAARLYQSTKLLSRYKHSLRPHGHGNGQACITVHNPLPSCQTSCKGSSLPLLNIAAVQHQVISKSIPDKHAAATRSARACRKMRRQNTHKKQVRTLLTSFALHGSNG